MVQSSFDQYFPIAIGVWIALGLLSAGFFFLYKNAAVKRKVFLPFMVLVGLLFLGFGVATDMPTDMLAIVVPFLVVIIYLNLRTVKFCDACGTTNMSSNPLKAPAFCHKCGAKLT
jgi:hypothetical protein